MEQLNHKIKAFDARIEELSKTEKYHDNVGKLACFMGLTRSRALAIVAEIGDFKRFVKPMHFAAYLGLVPEEQSSGDRHKPTAITKAGNSNIRKELIEAAQSICCGLLDIRVKLCLRGSKVMIIPLSIMPTRQAKGCAAGITNLQDAAKT